MYSSTPSQHGWCGTCKTDDDADKGKEGYCDWNGDKNGTQSEIMRPTSKKDWGWCSRTCNNFNVARTLQETKLDLLTLNQCSDFDSEMHFNRKNELCAGKKNYFPEVWKFKRNQSARKKSYHFKKIGTSTNYLGLKKTKYNFYVGGTDSCAGNYHQCIATHNCHIYHSYFQVIVEVPTTNGSILEMVEEQPILLGWLAGVKAVPISILQAFLPESPST